MALAISTIAFALIVMGVVEAIPADWRKAIGGLILLLGLLLTGLGSDF